MRRWSFYGVVALLFATGLAWWLLHRASGDGLPDPLEPWLMRLHGAAAMLAIYLAGTMLFDHMINAWQRARNRLSGGIAAGAWLVLALSGYGLYYFAGDGLRAWNESAHWVVGLLAPVLIGLHIVLGRRRKPLA